jgi:hypothetical protein
MSNLWASRARWRDLLIAGVFVAGNALWLGPLANIGTLGSDARLYRDATATWLTGGDPWALADAGPYHFSGLPPTVLAFVPTTALAGGVVGLLGVVVSALAAVWIIRRLQLPLWWLAFPPLVGGVFFANPDVVLLALLLGPLACLAPVLKVYAIIPLLQRPRQLLGAAIVFGATVVIAPGLWRDYLANMSAIGERLAAEARGGWSAWAYPPLLIVGFVGLALLAWRRQWKAVAWLAVPVLWPGTEFHYATMVLPVASLGLGVLAALPVPGLIAFAPLLRLVEPLRPHPAVLPRDRADPTNDDQGRGEGLGATRF